MAGRRRGLFPRLKWLAPVLLLLVALSLWVQENDNFHPITPGEAYRSAQLEPHELGSYIEKYGIRSILNLRGRNQRAPWYREEMKISAGLRVKHYDVPLTAYRPPGPDDIRALVAVFREAPRPILIHCQGGADRTGVVAAMWKVIVDKEGKAEARRQLSLHYGHLPWGRKTVLDRFFADWNPAPYLQPPIGPGS